MKNYITTAAIALLGSGSVMAATTSSKDGSVQTTGYSQTSDSNLPMLATGVQELGLSGRLNWEDDTVYTLNVSYGRFLTDNWLVGGRVSLDGVNSDLGYAAGVFAEYNFLTGTQWVPFAGVSADYNHRELESDNYDTLRLGLELGVKYFIRPNMAISTSIAGGWNVDDGDEGSDDGITKQINIGLRYYF